MNPLVPISLLLVATWTQDPDRGRAPAPAADERPADDPCDGDDPPAGCKPAGDEREDAAGTDERAATEPEKTEEPAPPPPGVPAAGEPADAPEAAPPEAPASLEDTTPAAEDDSAPPEDDPRVEKAQGEAPADKAPPLQLDDKSQREGLGFGAIPALNYNSDDGFGFGAVVSLYWYEKNIEPYKYALTAIVFMTTNFVQDHQLRFDALDVFGLPLRATFRGGYYQSQTQNFCGFGNEVTCSPLVAERAADARGLTGTARDDYVRRFYKMRFIRPYGSGLFRWRFNNKPHRFELMAGWRGHYYIPGNPFADDDGDGNLEPAFSPWPGGFYERRYPQGEPGFASVATFGFMLDDRDNEPAPTEGYWIEGSVRGSSILLGSSWEYVGANLTLRGYVPLLRYGEDNKLATVLASRIVLDGTFGDLPVQEMIRVGGSWDYTAFGGNPMGRGIRVQRYIGRIKVLNQTELRADFFEHDIFGQVFRWTAVGLMDAGYIGLDWFDFGGDPLKPVIGFGGGLRAAWEDNFIIRLDVATSADEDYSPGIYIDIGNVF